MLTLKFEFNDNLDEVSLSQLELNHLFEEKKIITLIQELCQLLQATSQAQFNVSGFGQDVWPVDVAVDLSIILEQLPEAIDAVIEDNYPFQLDFYEQGIERRLDFDKHNNLVKISCYSATNWIPNPSSILVEEEKVATQLLALRDSFLQATTRLLPEISSLERLNRWFRKPDNRI
jgi:hypothetical protein